MEKQSNPPLSLVPREKVVDVELIEQLEELLEEAKSGNVVSLALTYVSAKEENVSLIHTNGVRYALLGGVTWLQYRLLQGIERDFG